MPHIILDVRFGESRTGLGRFTREMTQAVLAASPKNLSWTLLCHKTPPSWLSGTQASIATITTPHYSLAEQWQIPLYLRKTKPDLFVSWHFNVPLLCPVPFIATVHDLILHAYPNSASTIKQLAYRTLIKHAVQHSAALLTVSPFVAKTLVETYGQAIQPRITITGEGAPLNYGLRDLETQKQIMKRWHITGNFMLYVGNAKEHKRLPLLLTAFKEAKLTDVKLVLVTNGPESEHLSLPPNVQRITNVPDLDLPALYSAALACVTASAYEGFYLPGVEALTCGCPVIAPRTTAIPDTISEAEGVLLVDGSLTSLVNGLRSVPKRPQPQQLWHWSEAALLALLAIERACQTSKSLKIKIPNQS